MDSFIVKVPATSANIGPGFDCLGVALNLFNEVRFSFDDSIPLTITAEGFRGQLPKLPQKNLIYRAFCTACEKFGVQPPRAMQIHCINNIPMGSGLGSSSSAIVAGICGANQWGGFGMDRAALLDLATEIEGHPDNVAPAIYGGLVAAVMDDSKVSLCRYTAADWNVAVVVPCFDLLTSESRRVLPKQVSMQDAVFNIAHSLLVVEALTKGDTALLRQGMQDRLHQQYRLPLIPGASEAVQAALDLGAAAGLSGAGPGVAAFTMEDPQPILDAMCKAFADNMMNYHAFCLKISPAAE